MNVTFSTEPYLVTIGDHVEATSVHFETHDGGVWVFREEIPGLDVIKRVTVGSNVYIGFGSIVLPGVTIGDNVVIGAGSVVTRDIPSNSVAVGVPARVIKSVSAYKEKAVADGAMTKLLSPEAKRQFYEHLFGSASSVDK
jgi:acetyltransferase-like isoleucine patch superfamily enzyme